MLLKTGAYGLIRVCLPLFPDASRRAAPYIAVLAIISIIYGALVALVQPNLKRLVAYSSVSHMGFVVLGIFAFTNVASAGRGFPYARAWHFHRRLVLAGRHALRAAAHL